MKKILFIIIFLFPIALVLCTYLYVRFDNLNKEIIILKSENTKHKQALEQNNIYIKSLQTQIQKQLKNNVNELRQQQNMESSKENEAAYIASTQTILSQTKRTISFWVNGPEKTMFDAMDLGLSFVNMKVEPTCTTGDVFSQYPLINSKIDSLTITGIAGISAEKITIGQINKRFASCTFEKDDPTKQAVIKLDTTKTHIYSLGTSVLDLKNSFKDIIW